MKYATIFFCLLALLFSACERSVTPDKEAKEFCLTDSLLSKSTIDTVKTETVTNELYLSGKVSFNEDNVVKIVALASGHIQDVKVSLGDFVKEGEVLAVVKSSDMAGYYNEFITAKSNLAVAKKNRDVAEEFYKGGLSSEKDFISAQNEYQKAESEANKIKEILKIYGGTGNADESTPAIYNIKAPISGFIVEKTVADGMEIRADDSRNLFTISSLKDVWVIANLYETDISKVQSGYSAEVSTLSYKDKFFEGKVDKVSNVLNPETKALNIRIDLENSDYLLKPGMFARILIKYPDNQKMLSVPRSSIIFDDNKNYVVKFNNKCDIQMQRVTVAKSIGERSYIQEDPEKTKTALHEGDRIMTRNGLFIFTAMKKM